MAEIKLFPIGYVDDSNIDSIGSSSLNLVTNGDMEIDDHWADHGTPDPNERSTEQVHTGNYSRKFVANQTYEGIKSDTFTTESGKRYKLTFWTYSSLEGAWIYLRKGDDSSGSDIYADSITPGQWEKVEYWFTETNGGDSAYISFTSGTAPSATIYIDGVRISDSGMVDSLMFEPNNGCSKQSLSYTIIKSMEDRSTWTYKKGEHVHVIEYNYENIWSSEYRIIKRFVDDVAEVGANDFYVIDFSSGVKVTALASTGGIYNASLYDTTDFSATANEGGHYVCLWNGESRKFRIGIISSYEEDSSITFPDSTDYGDLNSFSANKIFAYPVYRMYIAEDEEQFNVTNWAPPTLATTYAGPVRSGVVRFVQYDVR